MRGAVRASATTSSRHLERGGRGLAGGPSPTGLCHSPQQLPLTKLPPLLRTCAFMVAALVWRWCSHTSRAAMRSYSICKVWT